ncbi:MAG TPA: hypothetical protein ENJ18_11280 [Nannocystis exedens]|nr:hypothetical protein [Nannocystis exedens]
MGQQKIQLKHAYLQRAGVPVGRISWLFADNTPLLAANIVHPHRIEIYDLNAPLSDDLRQSLLLLTVALGWYEDAVSPDAS